MENCESCYFWTKKAYDVEWGYCEKCQSYKGYPMDKRTLAYAMDPDKYHASLETHNTFGCTQWAEKKGE